MQKCKKEQWHWANSQLITAKQTGIHIFKLAEYLFTFSLVVVPVVVVVELVLRTHTKVLIYELERDGASCIFLFANK